jgi:hypothetical protein
MGSMDGIIVARVPITPAPIDVNRTDVNRTRRRRVSDVKKNFE